MNRRDVLGRRAAVISGLAACLSIPEFAGAQTLPSVVAPPQVAPPATTATVPARPVAPVTTGIDKTKIYYLFFEQAIDINSMRALRRQLAALVEAGVTQIVLVVNSAGGNVLQSLITYSFIRSLPARIDTHAQGFVASAANLLFLAGEERSADRSARFVFHPSQTTLPGLLNEQQIHEQLTEVDTVADMSEQIYHERTTLSAADIQRFSQGEVIYTADQAKQNGIVQTVADLKVPGGQTAKILFMD